MDDSRTNEIDMSFQCAFEKLLQSHRRIEEGLTDELPDEQLPEYYGKITGQCERRSQMFRAQLDSTQDVVIFKDRNSVYLFCSNAFSELHGSSLADVIGKTVIDLFPIEQARQFLEEDAWVMETGQQLVVEHYWQTSRGPRWYEVFKNPLRDAQGNISGVFSIERDITERKYAGEKLRHYADGMAALHQTMLEINAHREINTLLQAIIQRAVELVGAQSGTVNLLQSDGVTQKVLAVHNMPETVKDKIYTAEKGISGRVIQTGEFLSVEDYRHWEGRVSPFDQLGFGRALGVPLKIDNKVVGSLVVGDEETTGPFSDEIVRLVGMFADQAALALQNAQLYEASQLMVADRTVQLEDANKALEADIAQREQAENLLRIQRDLAMILSLTDGLDEALDHCVEAVLQIAGIDAAGIYVVGNDTGAIELRTYSGLSEQIIADVRHLEDDIAQVQLIEAGRSLYVDQNHMPPSFAQFCECSGLRTVAMIPVLYQGRAIACIYAGSRTCDDIVANSRRGLDSVAAQIGAVIARLNVNEALRRNQENLQSLFDTIDDLLIVADKEGRIVDVNPVLLERLGYDKTDLVGHPVTKLHPLEYKAEVENIFKDMLEGKVDTCYLPLFARDGAALAVEIKATHGRWNSQDVLFGICRDVTEREKARQSLEESEARYRAIVEDQTEMVCRYLPDGIMTFANEAYCRYFGKSLSELIGKTFFPFIPEADLERIKHMIASFSENTPAITTEHRVSKPGSQEALWQQWTDRAIFDETGDLVEIQAVGRDITDRKQAEIERDEQRRMLRTLLDTAPDFIIVKDMDLKYIIANKKYCEVYGVSEAEIIGNSDFDDMLRPEDAERFREEDLQVIHSGETVIDRHVCKTPAGLRWDESIRVPLRGHDGEIIGVLIAARDITDRMQVEMERDEQRRMLQALLEKTLDIVVFKDRDSRYLASSETYRQLMAPDIPMDQFTGLTDFDVFPEEEARAYREEEIKVMKSGEALKAEHRIDTQNGHRWFEAVKMPLRNEQGEIVGVFTGEREITERLQIQAQLDDQHRRLRTLLDTLPDHIIFKDRDLVYRVVNQSYCDFWDSTMDEMVGKSDLDIWPEEEAKRYRAEELKLMKTGEPLYTEKFMMTSRGPNYREIVKTALRDSNGEIIGVLFAAHDITALKLVEERLKRRNKELATLNAVSAATSQSLDPEYILRVALEEILWVDIAGENPQAEVFLIDERDGKVKQVAHVNIPEAYLEDNQARGQYLCHLAAEQGQQVIISDDERYEEGDIYGVDTAPHRNLCLPLRARDRILGCINLWLPANKPVTQDDFFFLRSLSDQISVAIDNAQLYEGMKQQNHRIRALSQQLTESAENERKRLAQDLHDMVGQYLAALGINLSILQGMLPADLAEKVKLRIEESLSLVEQTTECIRGVMSDLRPPVLDDYGLLAALEWYAERFSNRMDLAITVTGEPLETRLPVQIENILFRIAQEALTNVAKHAKASWVEVALTETDDIVRLQIRDDGIGFDPESLSVPSEERGWGLLTIREWMETLGGRCRIESAPGRGAQITIELKRAANW